MRALRRGLVLVAVAAIGAAGCALILGIEDKPVRTRADAAVAAPDPCEHHLPPPMPEKEDEDPDPMGGRYTVAVRRVDVGSPDAGLLGFDLDDSCTCGGPGGAHDAAPSCKGRPATPDTPSGCDGDGGIDNAFGGISPVQAALTGNTIENDEVECGRRTILFVIRNYNGKANDRSVQIAPIISPGLDKEHEPGEPLSDCNDGGLVNVYKPRWDGTDEWSTDETFMFKKSTDTRTTIEGYVNDWTLVARGLPSQFLSIPVGPVVVNGRQAIIVGKIEPLDEGGAPLDPSSPSTHASAIKFRGQLTGRVAFKEIFRALQNIPSRLFGGFFCPTGNNKATYDFFQASICPALDVTSDPSADFTGQDCDAISTSVAFDGEPAKYTTSKPTVPPPPSPCPEVTATCP